MAETPRQNAKRVFDTSMVNLLVDHTDKVRASGSDNPTWNLFRHTILPMICGPHGLFAHPAIKNDSTAILRFFEIARVLVRLGPRCS